MGVDSFIGIPVDSSGTFAGCELMPAALRHHGMVERLELHDLGNLQAVISDPRRHPDTGVIGWDDFLAATEVIGTALASLLTVGATPLVSGGCCAILPGIAMALGGACPGWGLVFVDGHLDTYDGATSPSGEAADMELAMLLDGLPGSGEPILEGDKVMVVGPRDQAEAIERGSLDPRNRGAEVFPYSLELAAPSIGAELRSGVDRWPGHWIHLDLDVLSTESMPAVDYPQPGGLDWRELMELLDPVAGHPGLLGMSVTILNPRLDIDGTAAEATVDFLARLFGRA